MKLALIIFIGFCAISAQAYPSHVESARLSLVPDSILDFVSGLISAIKSLNEKVQEVATSIKDIIKSVLYRALQKASDAWAQVDAKLESIKRKGDKPKECVERYTSDMKDAKTKMDNTNKQCIADLTKEGEKVKTQLEDGVQALFDTVKQFYVIVDECASFNPIKSAKCIRDHMGQFKDFIMNAIHSTEQAIIDIRTNITEAAKTSAVCTKNSVVEFGLKQKEITGLIHDCMQVQVPTAAPTVRTTVADRTTKAEEERTTVAERTTKAEEERTTKVERTTKAEEERTTEVVEQTTKAEEERTTEVVKRTTKAEEVKTTQVVERTTKAEEERTTEVVEVTTAFEEITEE